MINCQGRAANGDLDWVAKNIQIELKGTKLGDAAPSVTPAAPHPTGACAVRGSVARTAGCACCLVRGGGRHQLSLRGRGERQAEARVFAGLLGALSDMVGLLRAGPGRL